MWRFFLHTKAKKENVELETLLSLLFIVVRRLAVEICYCNLHIMLNETKMQILMKRSDQLKCNLGCLLI